MPTLQRGIVRPWSAVPPRGGGRHRRIFLRERVACRPRGNAARRFQAPPRPSPVSGRPHRCPPFSIAAAPTFLERQQRKLRRAGCATALRSSRVPAVRRLGARAHRLRGTPMPVSRREAIDPSIRGANRPGSDRGTCPLSTRALPNYTRRIPRRDKPLSTANIWTGRRGRALRRSHPAPSNGARAPGTGQSAACVATLWRCAPYDGGIPPTIWARTRRSGDAPDDVGTYWTIRARARQFGHAPDDLCMSARSSSQTRGRGVPAAF